MHRRAVMLGALAAIVPASTCANTNAESLRRFIDEVVAAGDVSDLESLVTPGVTIPDYQVFGIEAFRLASVAGHEARMARFSEYAFDVVAVAGVDGWALAYARLVGVAANGQARDEPVFYAARFEDGLIAELYL